MRIDLNFSESTLEASERLAMRLSGLSIQRVGAWDSPALVPDCWLVLDRLSSYFPEAMLGPSVTNAVTRNPVITANNLYHLALRHPGGVYLGIGTGDSGVTALGMTRAKLEYTISYAKAVKELLEVGEAVWRGLHLGLHIDRAVALPIYMAAHGPVACESAATFADGMIVGLGLSPDAVYQVSRSVEVGASSSNRAAGAIDLRWSVGSASVSADPKSAGWIVASYAHHLIRNCTGIESIPVHMREGVRRLGELYRMDFHGRQPYRLKCMYVAEARREGILNYLRDRFTLQGNATNLEARLKELRARGIEAVEVSTSESDSSDKVSEIDSLVKVASCIV